MPVPTMPSRVSRMIGRVRRSWAEIDYAQRRMFELRTGISLLTTAHCAQDRARIEELEAWYALEAREPGDNGCEEL